MKRLVGRTDMEDALNRLDKLTHEEAQMASVESLRATHAVADTMAETEMDNRVRTTDDGVATVVDSTRTILNRSSREYLTLIYPDGTERKEAAQQSTSNVEQLKRLSSLSLMNTYDGVSYIYPGRLSIAGGGEDSSMALST